MNFLNYIIEEESWLNCNVYICALNHGLVYLSTSQPNLKLKECTPNKKGDTV